jgi:hypothetical protein
MGAQEETGWQVSRINAKISPPASAATMNIIGDIADHLVCHINADGQKARGESALLAAPKRAPARITHQ